MDNHIDHLETRPSVATFRDRYLVANRPAIISDLFSGEPISELTTPERALRAIGDVRLLLLEEYHHQLKQTGHYRKRYGRTTTLREYVDARAHTSRWVCADQPLPPPMLQLFRLPRYCTSGQSRDPAVYSLFVGRAGNIANLHFDGDHRHVLLHQVFGSKRIILFPPDRAQRFESVLNLALVRLDELGAAARRRMVAKLGGFEVELRAGQTLYIPALWWHYVEYLEHACAFNIRFGRPRQRQWLATKLITDAYVQNVSARLPERGPLPRVAREALQRIRRAGRAQPDVGAARYWYWRDVFRGVYRDCYGGGSMQLGSRGNQLLTNAIHDRIGA